MDAVHTQGAVYKALTSAWEGALGGGGQKPHTAKERQESLSLNEKRGWCANTLNRGLRGTLPSFLQLVLESAVAKIQGKDGTRAE